MQDIQIRPQVMTKWELFQLEINLCNLVVNLYDDAIYFCGKTYMLGFKPTQHADVITSCSELQRKSGQFLTSHDDRCML